MLLFLPIPLKAYIFGPIILAVEYYMSKRGGTGIAHDAHFAGAIFGILFITLIDYHYLLNFFSKIVG
jgi:membrane associated rhomboid family serine protease